jgi:hypothetical protein
MRFTKFKTIPFPMKNSTRREKCESEPELENTFVENQRIFKLTNCLETINIKIWKPKMGSISQADNSTSDSRI